MSAAPASNNAATGGGVPQHFLIISLTTKAMVHQQLLAEPSLELDGILLAVYDFLDGQPGLEEANIYLTRLERDSILIEPAGTTVFVEAFSGTVDRPRYKEFHRAVKALRQGFPQLGSWDGTAGGLPPDLNRALREHFFGPGGQNAPPPSPAPRPPAPAGPHPVPGALPPTPSTLPPAPGTLSPAPLAPPPVPMPVTAVPAPAAATTPPGPAPGPSRQEPDIQDCERKLRMWHQKGYDIEMLKDALHCDWGTLVATFDEYEKDVARLEVLRDRLKDLSVPGFEDEVRRLKSLTGDPARLEELEDGIDQLVARVRSRLSIHLPVSDPRQLRDAITALPLGVPSTLWGIPVERLVQDILSAERGLAPDGTVLVKLRAGWYHADPRGRPFLTPFSGAVRTARGLPSGGDRADLIDSMMEELLGKE